MAAPKAAPLSPCDSSSSLIYRPYLDPHIKGYKKIDRKTGTESRKDKVEGAATSLKYVATDH
jgi:hypothetical protein